MLFEHSPLPMWVYALDSGCFLAVNAAALAHYGYSEAEFLAMGVEQLGPAVDSAPGAEVPGTTARLSRHRRHDGSEIDVELLSEAVDFDGVPARLVLAQDVTERLRAERGLHEKKALLALAGRVAHLGGWSIDVPDMRLRWSDEVCEIYGVPPSLTPGFAEAIEFYAPEDRPRLQQALDACMRDGQGMDMEARLRTADDRLRWVRVIGQAERDELGRVVQVRGAIQDITERKLTEQEACDLAERLSTTLESITDAVFTLDRDWNFTYVNRSAEQVLQRSRESLLGRRIWDEFPKAVGSVFQREYERALAQNRATNFKEYYAPLGRWLEAHAYPSELGLTVYFRDVSELREAEDARQARIEAEESSRSKTRFLARLSHEMRTPLNAMLGFAQLLSLGPVREGGGSEQEDYAHHILQAGRHLLALVNDVLDLQQVEEGRLKLNPAAMELRGVAATAAELMAPLAATREIALHNDIRPGLRVLADEQRLRQVVINIVSNAVKYNRHAGRVQLTAEARRPGFVSLAICDTGPGIAPEQLQALFQPFERLGRESSAIEGTGLGLMIARRMTEEMGGTLELDSRVGQGTCVNIELPLASEEVPQQGAGGAPAPAQQRFATRSAAVAPAHPPAAGAPPRPTPERALRLLYVEDNPINALLFQETLALHPEVTLRIADNGSQGLQAASEERPDVLALDANLPDMNGFELLKRMRELPGLQDVPAYMCSADAMPEDLRRAREAGFAGYWTKPVDLAQVIGDLRALHAALRRP
ncbi:PAS domain S-box protein [Aquabacterium sp. A7-Y]|uniref:ATP-binding protein n=1 Tax=Aquabacterium sp. A7-Y TaxID=1349605 RepID=UPI00223DF1EA|nr:ATP-binding protein [Aquabacterium sp. A7-Y]MCW7538357.1 PAS domain S-box protein [Aquabacterium sp. A7-Y]